MNLCTYNKIIFSFVFGEYNSTPTHIILCWYCIVYQNNNDLMAESCFMNVFIHILLMNLIEIL